MLAEEREFGLGAGHVKRQVVAVVARDGLRQPVHAPQVGAVALAVQHERRQGRVGMDVQRGGHPRRSSYAVAIFMKNCQGQVARATMMRLSVYGSSPACTRPRCVVVAVA